MVEQEHLQLRTIALATTTAFESAPADELPTAPYLPPSIEDPELSFAHEHMIFFHFNMRRATSSPGLKINC
ncbi:hypothetical protein EW146_g81 [Bondarzewia mesenterica]|uniref:Uncharacterized protein n=1 Tax=Bondarzewia mesenterica TaxID=1095465 RepID=A0A4S4M808_9AGAM|nr:hypothetical protein EW146_g81 [Bondarzewia mesenterica]